MKIIFKIHPLMIFVILICILTGLFKNFVIFSLLIIVHELGHALGALYYKWHIKQIIILPFGGITIFNELINKSLNEEFVILVLGPLFQILFYFVLCLLSIDTDLIREYHYGLLFFNMLPIVPLDGSKLINIMCNKFLSFKRSHEITIVISIFVMMLLTLKILVTKNLVLSLIVFFLVIKNIKEVKEHKYLFNKFLFERYYYDINYKKIKIINGIKTEKMYKNYRHLFWQNKYYTEKDILKNYFKV